MYGSLASMEENDSNHTADTNIGIEKPPDSFNIDTGEDKDSGQNSAGKRPSHHDLQISRRWLYLSIFFAHFSENYWQFSAVLFLSAVYNFDSILYVSSFGLALNIGTFFVTSASSAGKSCGFTIAVLSGAKI